MSRIFLLKNSANFFDSAPSKFGNHESIGTLYPRKVKIVIFFLLLCLLADPLNETSS